MKIFLSVLSLAVVCVVCYGYYDMIQAHRFNNTDILLVSLGGMFIINLLTEKK